MSRPRQSWAPSKQSRSQGLSPKPPGARAGENRKQRDSGNEVVIKVSASLRKDVLQRHTSTGSELFAFLDSGFADIFGLFVSIRVKTLSNTNLETSMYIKGKRPSSTCVAQKRLSEKRTTKRLYVTNVTWLLLASFVVILNYITVFWSFTKRFV